MEKKKATKTADQHQQDIDHANIKNVIAYFNHPDRQEYFRKEIEKIPLVNGQRDPKGVEALQQFMINQFSEKMTEASRNHYIKIDRDLLFEKYKPFNPATKDQGENGSKGGRPKHKEKLEAAQNKIESHPPNKRESSSSKELAKYLNKVIETDIYKPDWVNTHLKRYIKK